MPDTGDSQATDAPEFPDVTAEEEQAAGFRRPSEASNPTAETKTQPEAGQEEAKGKDAAPGIQAGANSVILDRVAGVSEGEAGDRGKIEVSPAPPAALPEKGVAGVLSTPARMASGPELLQTLTAMIRCDLSRVVSWRKDGLPRLTVPMEDWTPEERAALGSIKRPHGDLQLEFPDKLKAIELLGKHLKLWGTDDAGTNRPSVVIQIGGALGAALAASRRQPVTLDVVPTPARLAAGVEQDNG